MCSDVSSVLRLVCCSSVVGVFGSLLVGRKLRFGVMLWWIVLLVCVWLVSSVVKFVLCLSLKY